MNRLCGKRGNGFTFIEVMIASSISVFIGITMIYLLVYVVREQRLGYVQYRVYEHANRLQDKITLLLQDASREAGVYYSEPDGAYYNRIVFRDDTGAKNEELIYNPNTYTLTYDPDRNTDGDEETLGFPNDEIAKLTDVRFRSAMKVGGIPDSSVILVEIEVTDQGYGRYFRDQSNPINWVTSTRSFAVNLRRL